METNRVGHHKRVAVIVDTSFLMAMASGIIAPSMIAEALEASHELIAPRAVRDELVRIANASSPRNRRLARRALELASIIGVKFLNEYTGNADDAIEALARDLKVSGPVVVATNDRGLRRRLRRLGVPSLYYRESEAMLEVEWEPLE